jgi:hypothetical protein
MLYVYRRSASDGANLLAEDICLQGVRARRTRGSLLQNVVEGDSIICWGERVPRVLPENVKVLNNITPITKYQEALQLTVAGVPTVEVALTPRRDPDPEPFAEPHFTVTDVVVNAANAPHYLEDLGRRLGEFTRNRDEAFMLYQANLPKPSVWLARRNNHIGGRDLLNPGGIVDYYSKKEDIIAEYRLHMFNGKSIRAGQKIARDNAHAWIRSFDAGWIISYDGFKSDKDMREIAASAVKALGLDFGAVDLARKADGSLIVLEVNRAPGIEGGTAEAYARRIVQWVRGEV